VIFASTPSFFGACLGAISLGLIVVGAVTWIWQFTRT
jgi:hypothetical protein